MKWILIGLSALTCFLGYQSWLNAALVTGSIAFTGFNADGSDGFAMVALDQIDAGETILFRDEEWDGTSAFVGTGEDEFQWTPPVGGVPTGTVVHFVTNAGAPATASLGTVAASGLFPGDMDISASGETVFAFQGASNSPTTFLASISTDADQDYSGSGLIVGSTAVVLSDGIDVAEYTGPRLAASFPAFLPLLGDTGSNWAQVTGGTGDQSGDILPFDTTPFAVPEPAGAAWFLIASGLLLLNRWSLP